MFFGAGPGRAGPEFIKPNRAGPRDLGPGAALIQNGIKEKRLMAINMNYWSRIVTQSDYHIESILVNVHILFSSVFIQPLMKKRNKIVLLF